MAVTVIFENLQKDADAQVDNVMPALLKRGADSNVFIHEVVDKCIYALCMFCSETKILNVVT